MAQPIAREDYKVLLIEDDTAIAEMYNLAGWVHGR